MRLNWLLAGLAGAVLLLLVVGWVNGGREPVRTIVQPVSVPELPR